MEFDSVFKRSSHVINFGTPDTVSTFCRTLPHSTCNSFPPSLRDTATGNNTIFFFFFSLHEMLYLLRNIGLISKKTSQSCRIGTLTKGSSNLEFLQVKHA